VRFDCLDAIEYKPDVMHSPLASGAASFSRLANERLLDGQE
jgi:hypothetical protein